MTKKKASPPQQSSCPYRGSHSDPETRFGFPASNTYCYKAAPPAPIDTGHQSLYCLTGEHVNCPVFQQREAAPLPAEIMAALPKKRRSAKSFTPQARRLPLLWVLIPVLVIIGGGILFTQIGRETAAEPTTPAIIAVATETATPTPTAAPATLTLAATNTPQPTGTLLPTSAATETTIPTNTPPPTVTATPSPTTPATETPVPTQTPTPRPTATPAPATFDVVVRLGRVIVRRGPESSYSPIASTGDAGATATAIGRSADSLWIEVCCFEGQSGWIPSGFVSLPNVLELPINTVPKALAIISEPVLNLLESPSYSAETVAVIMQGDEFELIGRFGEEWVKLCCVEDEPGWVYIGTLFIDGDIRVVPQE